MKGTEPPPSETVESASTYMLQLRIFCYPKHVEAHSAGEAGETCGERRTVRAIGGGKRRADGVAMAAYL